MFRPTQPLFRNFPLPRTAGPALTKVHLPPPLPSPAKASVLFSAALDPSDPKARAIYAPKPVPGSAAPVVFGNRIQRKHQDRGAGRNAMAPILCLDLFTLLDTQPLARALKAEIPDEVVPQKLQSVAESWRTLQVQYTFRLNAMDTYKPLNELIPLALLDALSQHGITSTLSDSALSALTAAFLSLPTAPDVPPFLAALANPTHPQLAQTTYLHSNAPLPVMDALVTSNPATLARFFYHPGRVRSVDEAHETPKRYKPHARAYAAFAEDAGGRAADVVLVTAQAWDVVGAKRAGWRVVWVDREGRGWSDGLGCGMGVAPDWRVEGLEGMEGVLAEM